MKIQAHVTKVENENSKIKGYADIIVENCCKFNCIRVAENFNGELFVSYPQKPLYEDGKPKLHENGEPMYTDVFYANSKEINDAIKALVLEAYHNENGYAYINPQKGEFVNAKIDPQLHACNDERVKASGRLTVGGYMKVPDIFVNLAFTKDTEPFLAVSYPHYKSGDEYKDFVEPLEKGKVWDREAKEEKNYNFKATIEGVMRKQTREFHPELAALLDKNKSVDEKIAEAKGIAEGGASGQAKEAEQEISK